MTVRTLDVFGPEPSLSAIDTLTFFDGKSPDSLTEFVLIPFLVVASEVPGYHRRIGERERFRGI
jgi:hypothetical protein